MRASTVARAAAAVSAAGAATLAWSLAEARAFTLRRFTLPVLPRGSAPVRVLHLSDLHATPSQRSKLDWLRSLERLEPDLVISTGDNLAHPHAVPAVLDAHAGLLDRPGVFVLGSNDYFGPKPKSPTRYLVRHGGQRRIHGEPLPTGDLVAGFRRAGWLDLTNRRGDLKIGDHLLAFVGVDDPHLRRDRYVSAPASLAASLTIGVTHAPYRRVLDAMARDGAHLLVAGHTHGGQLCVPGVGALVTNCDLDRGRAKGVSRWPAPDPALAGGRDAAPGGSPSDAWLHVSAGLGTNPYTPVRLACRPEASLLTLVAKPARP